MSKFLKMPIMLTIDLNRREIILILLFFAAILFAKLSVTREFNKIGLVIFVLASVIYGIINAIIEEILLIILERV